MWVSLVLGGGIIPATTESKSKERGPIRGFLSQR